MQQPTRSPRAFNPPMSPWLANGAPEPSSFFSQGLASPAASPGGPISSEEIWNRYQDLKAVDDRRHALFEELLLGYDSLCERLKSHPPPGYNYDIDTQRREQAYQDTVRGLQSLLDRDPYVLVLIAADEAVFNYGFLQKGLVGGQAAAKLLHRGVMDYICKNSPLASRDLNITARVYGDILSLQTANIDCDPDQVADFIQGFMNAQPSFDIIDVRQSLDSLEHPRIDFNKHSPLQRDLCANKKLSENLRMALSDYRCKQVFYSGPQSLLDGWVRDLAVEEKAIRKVVLLESGDLIDRETTFVPYRSMTIDGLFTRANTNNASVLDDISSSPIEPHTNLQVLGGLASLPPARAASIPDHKENSKSPGDGTKFTPCTPKSWAATIAKSQPHAAKGASTNTSITMVGNTAIPRNRKGQRVDPLPAQSREEIARVKNMKLCNMHHLRHDCAFGNTCTHDHDYKPTTKELQTLAIVARMAPCVNGSACDDVKCVYGHACSAPEGKAGKSCIHGESCRFPTELHGVDRKIVTLTKV